MQLPDRDSRGYGHVQAEYPRVILIADDDPEYRGMLNEILSHFGHTVIAAVNGAEAFELLQQHRVDLIVSDINMPRCTGTQLHEMVRETKHLQGIPFIYMTGLTILRVATPLRQGGMDYMVNKVPLDRLVGLIDEISIRQREMTPGAGAASSSSPN
jgi:CheY-like chemotaxis protein